MAVPALTVTVCWLKSKLLLEAPVTGVGGLGVPRDNFIPAAVAVSRGGISIGIVQRAE